MISEPAIDRLSAMFQQPDVGGTRYELISILGRGGMGTVYLARDTVLDREVALKIVERPAGGANEARTLAKLEHPGIVPVHDFGQLPDGRLFYAMKRVRGDRLDAWMANNHELADRLHVFLRVCDAVAFAHAHGVVHRDLKPENVMVGQFGEVLVLDWGIATTELQIANREMQIAGTVEYMAPEQARGDAAIDHRADVFSLGVILSALGDAAAIAAIARKARSHDPAARYRTVQEMSADVSRYLAGRAVGAHRERLLERAVRVGRKYRLPILLVLTYLIARILLLWLARI